MFKCILMGLAVIGSLFAATQSNAAIVQFNLQGNAGAGLLPGNEVPGIAAPVTGGEIGTGITFDDVTNLLTIRIGWGAGAGFTGTLSGNATAAHIHVVADGNPVFTSNGPVLTNLFAAPFTFDTNASAGTIFGSVTLTGADAARLMNRQLYINVHTAANPGGEIRGNLVAVPEPSSMALVGFAAAGFVAWKRRKLMLAKHA